MNILVIDEFVEQVSGDSLIIFPTQKDIREWLRGFPSGFKMINQGFLVYRGCKIILVTKDRLEEVLMGCRFKSVGVVFGTYLEKDSVDLIKSRLHPNSDSQVCNYFTLIH